MVYSKCEIEGVILVLEMSVEYFVVLFLIPPIENFLSSVTALLLLTSFNCLIYIAIQIFRTVHSVLCHFHELEVSVNLVKISGHLGIIGNDIADSKAKETAYMLLSGNISVPQNITFSNACKISANIAVSSLQRTVNGMNPILEDIHMNSYLTSKSRFCFLQSVILEYLTVECCFMIQC